jgi:hypothetical protein
VVTLRKAISLVLACSILSAGLWLLRLQLFVWHSTIGLVALITGFMILIGVGWLLGDFILPLFPGSADFLKRTDAIFIRGNALLGVGFQKAKAAIGLLLRTIVLFAGLGIFLAAFACWIFQGYIWLMEGVWTSIPVSAFIDFGGTGWIGMDKILLWLLEFNAGIPLFFIGFWTMALSMMESSNKP